MKKHFLFLCVIFILVGTAFAKDGVRDAVVGNGTPESCTEAALDTAITAGGIITFNCGVVPHTIVITTTKVIGGTSADLTLDGGGKVVVGEQCEGIRQRGKCYR
jgi:hypothetical protein